MPFGPKKRSRPWDVIDQRRESAEERGYDNHWRGISKAYRRANPLCVNCLLQGRVKPSQATDHIIPIACWAEGKLEQDNWAALCTSCHSYKTTKEPRYPWTPRPERVVVCGLPGTGKTTWARERDVPYFDADELGLEQREEIIAARTKWIAATRGPCTVIVASTVTASIVAAQLRGIARHMTEVFVDRPARGAVSDRRP